MKAFIAAVCAAALFWERVTGASLSVTSSGSIEQMSFIRKEIKHHNQAMSDGGKEEPDAVTMTHGENDMDSDIDDEDMCDMDFIPGSKGVSSCSKAHGDYQQILEQQQCFQAARLSNASVVKSRFRITREWYDIHPRGCFTEECAEDPKGICYWFNPIGDDPVGGTKGIEGNPVCVRPRYKNGTADGTKGVHCDKGYGSVMTEEACMKASVCLGYCKGDEFRKGMFNASRYDEFPLGCFVHAEQGCVFFNPPQKGIKRLPRNPRGTPLCNVTSTTFYPWKAEYEKPAPGASPITAGKFAKG